MTVDPGERQLLAQFLGVAVVSLDVDRALEAVRLVQSVQLVLNRLMTERSLQVTDRKALAFAACLHLWHPAGEKRARTVPSPDGLLIVDYGGSGRPLGVEIAAPQGAT